MFGKLRYPCFIVGGLIWALAGVAQAQSQLADRDGNGLIEVDSLIMLHNMRHNLAGTSYKTSVTSAGETSGCPQGVCKGYELTQDLDFDLDGDGSAWSIDGNGNYSLDAGDHQSPYFDVDASGAGGWKPIGTTGNNPFNAVFDGNGYSIRNLAIRRSDSDLGLFGIIGGNAAIRNLGLIDNLTDYTGSSNNPKAAGGLVGWQRNGSITASYATGNVDGGSGNQDRIGVLVGAQSGGSIVASYATGNADGRGGSNDRVGALVGWQENGSIVASHAKGNADGGGGNDDSVGALVGRQENGSIAAAYATGNADGGSGTGDNVGALVGRQEAGSITASYATGPADGGGGTGNSAGALVGRKSGGSIMDSYGFGPTMADIAGDAGSTRPMGVGGPADLASGNAGGSWNASASNTRNAWDFGTSSQIPALKYADYDDSGTTFNCNQFPAGACGTLLPGQAGLIAGGSSFSVVEAGSQTMLSVTAAGRVTITSWLWQQLGGADVALTGTATSEVSFLAPNNDNLLFKVTATDGDGNDYVTRISLRSAPLADNDNNGLIDIDSLTKLHNMRHNLAGTSYRTSATSFRNTLGCPQGVCTGYELTQDLDFDTDGDGDGTWSVDNTGNYSLDAGDHQSPYFEVTNGAGGWQPIGDDTNHFAAVFEGNGHRIHNLAIRRDQVHVGLFGVTDGTAAIRNLGLVANLADYTGSDNGNRYIGGLVGRQQGGSITASHATGNADGGGGNFDSVGALVGRQQGGVITASYATGNADGGGGNNDSAGALVGWQSNGSITASYATGNAAGGGGTGDNVGALVGWQQNGSITASYATGPADGGGGTGDSAGALVGRKTGGSITASYGFGPTMAEIAGDAGSTRPGGVGGPADLTAGNAGASWNADSSNTLGAWDFGTGSQQIPVLKYADYDGVGTRFDCNQFPAGVTCGTTLLPRQAGLIAGGASFSIVRNGLETVLSVTAAGRVAISSWSWQQLEGTIVALTGAASSEVTFLAPDNNFLLFEVTATGSDGNDYVTRISLFSDVLVDSDGDGLIDIDSLTRLDNMRHNLAGTSYRSSATSLRNTVGCPQGVCTGYELTQDLDFDLDGDGSTWLVDSAGNYSLDAGDHRSPYFGVTNGTGGWQPIGTRGSPFTAVFEGNGNSIRNLAIRRNVSDLGLFGAIGGNATIRNIGLISNLADHTGSGRENNIGGLVGAQQGGLITASHATGDVRGGRGSRDRVGVLVGAQFGGAITASYATGNADDVDGRFNSVGALVGRQENASITASYATGNADGGGRNDENIGALVGEQINGSITASYATGNADGGVGRSDAAGALVGWQKGGSITASYATGNADGGGGSGSSAGALVGLKTGGSITASYGFGTTMAGIVGPDGPRKPGGVVGPADLTAGNAGGSWNAGSSNTHDAWDFGTNSQTPALRYADYDDSGTTFDCDQFLAGVTCGTTLLPQASLIAGGSSFSSVENGSLAMLSVTATGRSTISSWSWQQLGGAVVALTGTGTSEVTFLAPDSDFLVFEVTATDSDGKDHVMRISLGSVPFVDSDGNGLIDIDSLTKLHNMRYNLAGTSYRSSAISPESTRGCPQGVCTGYELTGDLDFDFDGDGSTWSVDGDGNYSLDADDHHALYFVVDANNGTGGWQPIGNGNHAFMAVLEGNGFSIRNLALRRDGADLGLFGAINTGAAIRNLGLVGNLTDYSGSSGNPKSAGGLVGWQRGGSITASHATGDVDGGSGNQDRIGVLVGAQSGGSITASYATGNAAGGGGNEDSVGALVGRQSNGSITASHATGNADGGGGVDDRVGALVGWQEAGSITASYATGNADGGDGNDDSAGALVGRQSNGSIAAGYATGNADGGGGTGDRVGALVGWQENGSITASYATGPADGGGGTGDSAGALVGRKSGGSITDSYGFGPTTGEVDGDAGTTNPVAEPADLTANAGTSWNAAANNTLDAWDFGTDSQIPALKYADYDGGGNTFDCSQFPAGVTCGTLLPRQAGLIAGGASFSIVGNGLETVLSVTAAGRVPINSWSWRKLGGADVTLTDADTPVVTFLAPDSEFLLFEVTATDGDGNDYVTRISLRSVPLADGDGNGLIDIDSLTKLHNMRHDLAGTSYRSSATSFSNTIGCPQGVCTGYELTGDLDFDFDGDGSAWSIDGNGNYSLDADDDQNTYFDVDAGGWQPIGDDTNPFTAVFEGNSHSIHNLAIRRDARFLGLFGAISGSAAIRNLGLVDNLADYTGSGSGNNIGGLVGWQQAGSITASHATGDVEGGSGGQDRVGVLVGAQSGGSITASHATGNAAGGGGMLALWWAGRRFDHGQPRHGQCRWRRRNRRLCWRSGGLAGKRFDHGGLRHGQCRWRRRKR